MSEFSDPTYLRGWTDAIQAVNEQAGPGMADAVREARVQALRDAAASIRKREFTIYGDRSGFSADEWGHDEHTIDGWYADYLNERAKKIEDGGQDEQHG